MVQLIVAVNPEEDARLGGLFERGLQNEVPDLRLVGPEEIQEIEPICQVNMIPGFLLGGVSYTEVLPHVD